MGIFVRLEVLYCDSSVPTDGEDGQLKRLKFLGNATVALAEAIQVMTAS